MRFASITFVFILCLGVFAGCKTIDEVGVNIKFPSTETEKVKHKGKVPLHMHLRTGSAISIKMV